MSTDAYFQTQSTAAFLVLDTQLCDECVFFVENQGRKKKKRRGRKEKGLERIDSAEIFVLSTELCDVLSSSHQPHM